MDLTYKARNTLTNEVNTVAASINVLSFLATRLKTGGEGGYES